jgi:hypothetical protein
MVGSNPIYSAINNISVAQSVEQRSPKPPVGGSTPSWYAKHRIVMIESITLKIKDRPVNFTVDQLLKLRDCLNELFPNIKRETVTFTWPYSPEQGIASIGEIRCK